VCVCVFVSLSGLGSSSRTPGPMNNVAVPVAFGCCNSLRFFRNETYFGSASANDLDGPCTLQCTALHAQGVPEKMAQSLRHHIVAITRHGVVHACLKHVRVINVCAMMTTTKRISCSWLR